jgi:hypothetical protein
MKPGGGGGVVKGTAIEENDRIHKNIDFLKDSSHF